MTALAFTGPGVDDHDGDMAEVRPTPLAASPLAALQAAMAVPLPKEHLALSPLKRPNVEVRLRTNVDIDEINVWREGAKDPSFDGGYNLVRLACIFLANSSVDIIVDGQSTGLTLASAEVKAMYPRATDQLMAVRAFFGDEDLWLSGRVLPHLSAAWSGGPDNGQGPLRPIELNQ